MDRPLESAETFTFPTGLLGKRRMVRIEGEGVRLGEGGGDWMRFDEIAEIRFWEAPARRMMVRNLDLHGRTGKLSIGASMPRSRGAEDPDAAEYFQACEATLRAIAAARPELQVTLRESRTLGGWFFVLGLLAILIGVGLPAAAVLTGRGNRLDVEGIIPVLALLLFGTLLTWSYRPWRPFVQVPVEGLAEILERMRSKQSESTGT